MAYITPSPLIYQQLANAGGVANISPDLNAVIVGPCFNVVTFDGTSAASLTNTAARNAADGTYGFTDNEVNNVFELPSTKVGQVLDEASLAVYFNEAVVTTLKSGFTAAPGSNQLSIVYPTASGTATSGSGVVTVASGGSSFYVGDLVTVSNFGPSGTSVTTSVSAVTGNQVTVGVTASASGAVTITKNAPAYSPASASANSAVLSDVTNVALFAVGDEISLAGAGVSGAALVANILSISGTSVTVSVAAATTVSGAQMHKTDVNNLNTVSATLKVEDGATAVVSYVTSGSVHRTFTSTVSSYVATNNILSAVFLADILPADVVAGLVSVSFTRVYNNQLVPASQYDMTEAAAAGTVTVLPTPELVYGLVNSANVHIGYRALRTDIQNTLITISSEEDITGMLGVISDENPLALGALLSLSNTTTQVLALAVASEDLAGYVDALGTLENSKVYSLVPLTQSIDILTSFQQHVEQLSVPKEAGWRVALVSTAIPSTQNIGQYTIDLVNVNGGNNTITLVNGRYILTASNATFISDGAIPGDLVQITAATSATSQVGAHQIKTVLNNQQVEIVATSTATAVNYYVTRNLTKAQQAAYVAANSTAFKSNRVYHTPNLAGVVVNGVTKYLPGYYFMCGVAGLVAGLPSQSGLTNIALAGFVDVKFSNFYFTRAQMDVMASAGTFLMVQEAQGSIPYIRHSISTDMSVLQYRELQQVKNWDYISYFFHDILKVFVGKWNITPDSLQTLRQSITASGNLLKGRKLPKVGAPLVDFSIKTLKQDPDNLDNVICEMPIDMPEPMNNASLFLIV